MMVDPRVLELAVERVRANLANLLTDDEASSVEDALAILRSESAVEPDDRIPSEIDTVLTDEEIERILAYLNDVEEEIQRLYDRASRR